MKDKKLRMPAWIVVTLLSFGLIVLGVSVNEVKGEQITIKEGEVKMEQKIVTMENQKVSVEAVDYYLPYPGILPDHPFYWLKMIRDRVQLWLVSGDESKTEKLLANADKRLGAGFQLVEGNKVSLGVTTLTKAEKYLEQATLLGESLDGAEDLKVRLGKANRKHKEVIQIIKDKVGDEYKGVLEQMLKMQSTESLVQVKAEVVIEADGVVNAYKVVGAKNALEALELASVENQLDLKVKKYDFGSLVESIKGKENTVDKAWIYSVNGESATVGADKYELQDGDLVEWKYTKPIM